MSRTNANTSALRGDFCLRVLVYDLDALYMMYNNCRCVFVRSTVCIMGWDIYLYIYNNVYMCFVLRVHLAQLQHIAYVLRT